MAIQRISRTFKDISLSFAPHPVTKDLPILKNENAIVRSVRNLVETIPTERFFNSSLGSDVQDSLFGFVDYGTASQIEDQIITTVTNFEPRVENINVEVEPQMDNNSFGVIVQFDIVGQAFPPQEFAFLLETTR
jgi:phage baseplate assembly protein W